MDDFDPVYTPNHDDHALRYAYKNQPTIIWWNLVRFGEAIGELMGMGPEVDSETFVTEGVKEGEEKPVIARAEKLIMQAGEEFKAVFKAEYHRLMTARLGLKNFKESDFDQLYSEALDTMEALELDFHHFFRRLSSIKLDEVSTLEGRTQKASVFFHKEGAPRNPSESAARERIANWLEKWQARVIEDWKEDGDQVSEAKDNERIQAMKQVNPNFIPRGWVLDEVIQRVQKSGEREVLDRIMFMTLHPFEDSWDGQTIDGVVYMGDKDEESRWIDDPPKLERALQCSCSS